MAKSGKKIQHYIQPMLATSVDRPFSSKEWLFELKLDGYRAITELKKGKIVLYSRNGLSLSRRYPSVVSALKKIKIDVVLDGEIVLLDEKGKPNFQQLQNYNPDQESNLAYYVFDILYCQHKDLRHMPLIERKKLLKKILKRSGPVRFSKHIEEHGEDFFKAVRAEDMEGIMAKKKDSLYTPGARTREWLKIKNHKSQEAIIVGYTEPKGNRMHLGAILLAQYEKDKLKYIGHAGTGFTEQGLKDLMQKLKPLARKKSPLDSPVKANNRVTWVRPKLVCEVGYSELTKEGILRHPVFKGLRPDKVSTMVNEEEEKTVPLNKIVKQAKIRS